MLSADFGHLDRDTRMIDKSAAQWVHIDVMDGVFVPNISFGFPVLKFIRQATTKPLDVHLMIVEPERYVKRFAEAGSDIVTFHYEATNAAHRCIDEIHAAGGAGRHLDQAGHLGRSAARPAAVARLGARDERRTGLRRTKVHGRRTG